MTSKEDSILIESKEILVNNIKEWIKIDNDINNLKINLKEKTTIKKKISEDLVNIMKNNEIDCFDINDGLLVYKQTKVKKTITGKNLINILNTYYKNQPVVAEELTKHILDNREEFIKDTIKRKMKKIT